jgi:hypothetical protein
VADAAVRQNRQHTSSHSAGAPSRARSHSEFSRDSLVPACSVKASTKSLAAAWIS